MSKNVAVFVDVANIFYAAKAAGADIDYVTLLKAAIAGRDFVRAYAYTGLDPENENQRQFHSFLARNGYKVVSKDIRKYGDGRIKANLDIELVVDMMKLSRNLDVAVVISGDGDFAPAIRAVQEMGVRVEVISFRGNTSSDLIEAADVFTDIVQLARVETGSSRSGRRVAADGDLSMTEVPDKETEGLARRRRGGTGRRGERTAEPRTRTAAGRDRDRDRDRDRVAATAEVRGGQDQEAEPVGLPGNLIVLPGEKLSRAGRAGSAGTPLDPERTAFDDVEDVDDEAIGADEGADDGAEIAVLDGGQAGDEVGGDGRRRRRRRGGRGRGRGRGGEQEFAADAPASIVPATTLPASTVAASSDATDADAEAEPLDDDELDEPQSIRMPQHSAFGSVWDSQLGVPTQSILPTGELGEDEFEDEPEIPEYLLAERRQSQQRRSGPNRMGGRMGGRNAGYQSAVDRERYGRGGVPTTGSSFGAPRRDDRGGRPGPRQDRDRQGGRGQGQSGQGQGGQGQRPPRQDRPDRPDRPMREERPPMREPRPTGTSGDPWSEVPPELEELLREELARKTSGPAPSRERDRGEREPARAARQDQVDETESGAAATGAVSETGGVEPAAPTSGRGRGTRARGTGTRPGATTTDAESVTAAPVAAGAPTEAEQPSGTESAPKGRRAATGRAATTRRRATGADPSTDVSEPASAAAEAGADAPDAGAAPKRRRRKPAAPASDGVPTAAAESVGATDASDAADSGAAPKRRTRRTASSSTGTAGDSAGATDVAPEAAAPEAAAPEAAAPEAGAKPKRRTRKTAEALPSES